MYHVGEETRPCPFPVTGNGHGRVTEPKGDQFSGRNLCMIPYYGYSLLYNVIGSSSPPLKPLKFTASVALDMVCNGGSQLNVGALEPTSIVTVRAVGQERAARLAAAPGPPWPCQG